GGRSTSLLETKPASRMWRPHSASPTRHTSRARSATTSVRRRPHCGERWRRRRTTRFMAMSAASRKDHPNNAPGVPMVFPVAVENFQVKYFNPVIKPFVRYLPGMATIKHRGRKSGKPYETIVTASPTDEGGAMALGPGQTAWANKVLAW